jgi:DNA replication and repair protein RecF
VSKESSSRLELTLEIGRKAATVDGNTPRSVSSYLGEFHTVIFTPLDLNLSRGNQELRRRFLDRAIFLREPAHLERLQNYNRVLKQRNALLRSGRSSIEVWDESVAALGASIHAARKKTLQTLGPMIASVHEQIAGRPEKMIIACGAPYATGGDLQEGLRRTLSEGRERDRRLGFTGVGPHRDAVRIQLGGKDIERHGSQGQMRTAALSLKLGLLSWGRESLGEAPLFLLDDPASELDRKRLAHLGEFLARWPGQVMTAGTERNAVPVPANAEQRYFRLAEGRVVEA